MSKHSPAPKIYLINLDKSKDRLLNCHTILASQQLSFERIPAVLGDALTTAQKHQHYSETLNNRNYYRPLSNGEVGCYLSHRAAWQKIADGDAPYGIVLEDDIAINGNMHLAIDTLDTLHMDWQVIKLSAYQSRTRPIVFSQPIGNGFDLVIHNKPMTGCAASAITKEAAKKLLAQSTKFGRPVDVDIQHFWESNVEVCSLMPYPISQDMSYQSTITQRKGKAGKRFWQRKIQQLTTYFLNKRHIAQQVAMAKKS
ncbi:glycosyl transferase family 25 [Thalassotalea euphylliae]|uniref:Glycosyl transferase family 25 n=1 Tax=Thalassotalea euphylliae TaxID=1655234 RepID=A0A3E0TNZ8_9GAMM|nr:glycosyltransferase family 25 protein [Thalassotalea euphylliae]REL26296.1 glycosyl transferase family 25 [Thalassotalea euphylliae]